MISTVTITEPAVAPKTARDLAPWPSDRSRRTAIVAQFGGDRADLAQWALTTADPLADAVAAAIHAKGAAVRAAFSKGVTDGLASLADPHPAVAALLASTEALPDSPPPRQRARRAATTPPRPRRQYGHASRQSPEIYSRIALADAQQSYEEVIGRFPV